MSRFFLNLLDSAIERNVVLTPSPQRIPAEQAIQPAVDVLRSGGLVAFPTETAYGVGAVATHHDAIRRLRQIKSANEHTAFTLHVPDVDTAHSYIDENDWLVHRAMDRLLPGPVTLLVQLTQENIHEQLQRLELDASHADHLFIEDKLGLRLPNHDITQKILKQVKLPVVAALASRAKQSLPTSAEHVVDAFGGEIDLIVDGGMTRFGKASTLVCIDLPNVKQRLHVQSPTIYDARYVEKRMQWTLLFVCSGNTCRSPMAEVIGRQLLAEKLNLSPDDLSKHHVRVISAGTYAGAGMPASSEAVEAMKHKGLDLSQHRSRPLTPELIEEADVIFGMTQSHVEAVRMYAPSAARKVHLLDEKSDISDPVGMSLKDYQQTAKMIENSITKRLNQFNPTKK